MHEPHVLLLMKRHMFQDFWETIHQKMMEHFISCLLGKTTSSRIWSRKMPTQALMENICQCFVATVVLGLSSTRHTIPCESHFTSKQDINDKLCFYNAFCLGLLAKHHPWMIWRNEGTPLMNVVQIKWMSMENSHNKRISIPVTPAILCTLVPVPLSTLLNFNIIWSLKRKRSSMT
jgi:hypothetical protein